jgi:hypothetical protein
MYVKLSATGFDAIMRAPVCCARVALWMPSMVASSTWNGLDEWNLATCPIDVSAPWVRVY